MSTDAVAHIRQLVASGADAKAKSALVCLVRTEPENVQAWELLATLCDDLAQQVDCYRQILRVEPENQRALARLEALHDQAAPSSGAPAEGETVPLRCRHCGGQMAIQFFGETRDNHAVCPYCGNMVDVPDTFQRVQRRREEQSLPHGKRIVETVLSETRSARGGEGVVGPWPEAEALPRSLQEKDVQDFDKVVQQFEERGFHVVTSTESLSTFHVENGGCLTRLLQLLGIKVSADG